MKTQRSRPFIKIICPRSEAGSVIMTTVLLFPFERTRYLAISGSCPVFPDAMSMSTWKPSEGKRTLSAFSDDRFGAFVIGSRRGFLSHDIQRCERKNGEGDDVSADVCDVHEGCFL